MKIEEVINVINTWELPMRKSVQGDDFANEFLDAVDVLKKKEIQYRWHDLRKDPTDLPTEFFGQYLCYERYWNPNDERFEEGYVLYFFINGKFSTKGQKVEVIAWKEIEPFEVDE